MHQLLNHQATVKEYYEKSYENKEVIFIIPKKTLETNIEIIRSQLCDILNSKIKPVIITDSSKESKLGKLKSLSQIQLITSFNQEKESYEHSKQALNEYLINEAFKIATSKNISSIFYLDSKTLRTSEGKKLNNLNAKSLKHISLPTFLDRSIINIFNHMKLNPNITRFHILNILAKKSLYKELFTINGAGNGNGVMLANNFDIEFSSLTKLDNNSIVFLKTFLTQNKKYLKERTIEYILSKQDNFIIGLIDGIPIGMFESIELGEKVVEIGAFNIDYNLQGLGIGSKFIDYIVDFMLNKKFKNKNIIFVSFNKSLIKMLEKKGGTKLQKDKISCKSLKVRYEKMLSDSVKDGQNREMIVF